MLKHYLYGHGDSYMLLDIIDDEPVIDSIILMGVEVDAGMYTLTHTGGCTYSLDSRVDVYAGKIIVQDNGDTVVVITTFNPQTYVRNEFNILSKKD